MATKPKELSTWDMACAVLVALRQTHDQAQADYVEVSVAGGAKPTAPGLLDASSLIQAIQPSLKQLEADLRSHARSGGLEFPEGK